MVIANCIVSTGDDAIVVKSTGPMSRRYGVCENITITNCVLHSRDSALKIGTETHGTIRNVTLSDCIIDRCSVRWVSGYAMEERWRISIFTT